MVKRFQTKLGEEDLIIEIGKMAKQASGSCTVQLGGTVVLVTCVSSKKPREGIDYFPLFVEYQEKTYAAGKIPGGFFKRDGMGSTALDPSSLSITHAHASVEHATRKTWNMTPAIVGIVLQLGKHRVEFSPSEATATMSAIAEVTGHRVHSKESTCQS